MHRLLAARRLPVIAALLVGCFDQSPPDGALKCAADPTHPCPNGFYCASDETCWRSGHAPDLTASVVVDGGDLAVTMLDGGGGSLDLAGDLSCVNLQCSQMQCDGASTTVSGTVFTPSGLLPLPNVVVYVPNTTPDPMPTGVVPGTCSACFATVTGAPIAIATTDGNGNFVLTNVPAGDDVPLVLQVGRWRRQVKIPHVTPCTNTAVTADLTHLPRTRFEGDIPQHAVTTTFVDSIECLLRVAGIDDSEFTAPEDPGRVHIYEGSSGGGMVIPDGGADAGAVDTDLWDTPGAWSRYDVLLFSCEGSPITKTATAYQNFSDFTGAGGRIFLEHYGNVWLQMGFLGVANWNPTPRNLGGTLLPTNVDTSFPQGAALASWLGQYADAGATLYGFQWREDVLSVNPPTTRWLYGTAPSPSPHPTVQQMSFETPLGASTQCGHVVYTDFHISAPVTASPRPFPTECPSSVASPGEQAELIYMLFNQPTCRP